MTLLDIILGVILLIAFISGLKKGLFVTLASLVGLVAGVYGAVHFSYYAGNLLLNWFSWSEQVTHLVAFAVTFIAIVIVVSLAGKFLTKIVSFAALGPLNKLLGGVFNVLIYAFIVSVVFMFLNASQSVSGFMISEERKSGSRLYTPIASVAPLVLPHILKDVDINLEEE